LAWPNTPLTTYTFDGAPPIKSMDLNAIQDAINRIINGTYSLRSVTIDGTGGNIVAPAAGTLNISGNIIVTPGSTLRTDSVTFNAGAVGYPASNVSILDKAIDGNQCKGWGVAAFDGAGAATLDSIGCVVNYTAGHSYFGVTLNDNMTSNNYSIAFGIADNVLGTPSNIVLLKTFAISANGFSIDCRDLTNAPVVPTHSILSFTVFGRQP